jgi:ribosomal protein L37E
MASIHKRKNRDGTFNYRVQIRRKGIKHLIISFPSLKEAKDWAKNNEKRYIDNPDLFNNWMYDKENRIRYKRNRLECASEYLLCANCGHNAFHIKPGSEFVCTNCGKAQERVSAID